MTTPEPPANPTPIPATEPPANPTPPAPAPTPPATPTPTPTPPAAPTGTLDLSAIATKLDALPETLVNAFREATQPPTRPTPGSGAAGQPGTGAAGQPGTGAAGQRGGPGKFAQWWFGSR